MSPMRQIALGLLVVCSAPLAAEPRPVPAEFVRDQVWVVPQIDGVPLRLFTDTGGGWNALSDKVVDQFDLARETSEEGDLVAWPQFDPDSDIPPAPAYFVGGRFAVAPAKALMGGDGFLGGRWFAGGVWEFDYPGKRLLRHDASFDPAPESHRAKLGFQTDDNAMRTTHFPSIDVEIDSEVLPMLLDTGATATTTETSAAAFGVAPGTNIGASFIEKAVFDRWRAKHPNWRVLEAADLKGTQQRRMIEVPSVTVAGYTVGPVWFSEQPEGSFQSYMARMMDRPTWGALGGSGLKFFRVIVDYPAATAHFWRGKE